MKVYRYMCKEELEAILNCDIDKIGRTQKNDKFNNHHYKKDIKYLHFFKNLKDIEKIKKINKHSDKQFYIGTFNIPLRFLLQGMGVGYYPTRGYDADYVTAREFIVPVEKFKPNYLVEYIRDFSINKTNEISK